MNCPMCNLSFPIFWFSQVIPISSRSPDSIAGPTFFNDSREYGRVFHILFPTRSIISTTPLLRILREEPSLFLVPEDQTGQREECRTTKLPSDCITANIPLVPADQTFSVLYQSERSPSCDIPKLNLPLEEQMNSFRRMMIFPFPWARHLGVSVRVGKLIETPFPGSASRRLRNYVHRGHHSQRC